MTRIGLISDTHGNLDPTVMHHFQDCHEIWHAGDFGGEAVADALAAFRPLRGVYGNIDGYDIRSRYPERLVWTCEDLKVYMIHIGGYPGRYAPGVKADLTAERPGLFISGHSHILKIMPDKALHLLHINPGAAGNQGWHKVKTLVRFTVEGDRLTDCQVIELGARSQLEPRDAG